MYLRASPAELLFMEVFNLHPKITFILLGKTQFH